MTPGLFVDVEHRRGSFTLRAQFEGQGGVLALFGPSGSGKSTLVDVIAGLLRPDRGRVAIGGTVLLDTAAGVAVPAHRRRVGYVFQDARLFPHLSVRQNLLFGRWFAPRSEPGPDLAATVDLLGIGHLLGRRPAGLSGGERQRVAIGRALLAKPRLLLLDEPLAALDEGRKAEILPFIEKLRDGAGLPIVYVSHSVREVARVADRVVLLRNGAAVASGAPGDVFARPDLAVAADPSDAGAVLDGVVTEHDPAFGLTTLSTRAGVLRVALLREPPGARRRVHVRARDVTLSLDPPGRTSALNVLSGRVDAIAAAASGDVPACLVRVSCGGVPILARVTAKSLAALALSPGVPVHAIIKTVALDPVGSGAADGQTPLA